MATQIQERIEGLAARGREALRNIYDNAPLLRYINPNSRYNQVPTGEESDPSRTRRVQGHVVHIGETHDGVFSNMPAKPSTGASSVPDQLPSYDEASHDPSPPYWETSIMSEFDEIYIDGIPVGNIFNFLWSALVSVLFQFLGFVITYLLHTSHSAKNGAQVGLGVTIINLGFSSLPIDIKKHEIDSTMGRFEPSDPSTIDVSLQNGGEMAGSVDGYHSALSTHGDFRESSGSLLNGTPILAYFLFSLGGFIICKAIYDFYKVKRLEYSIMCPLSSAHARPEETATATAPEEAV